MHIGVSDHRGWFLPPVIVAFSNFSSVAWTGLRRGEPVSPENALENSLRTASVYVKESLDKQFLSSNPPPIHVQYTGVKLTSQLIGLAKMCGNKNRSSYFICFHTVSSLISALGA